MPFTLSSVMAASCYRRHKVSAFSSVLSMFSEGADHFDCSLKKRIRISDARIQGQARTAPSLFDNSILKQSSGNGYLVSDRAVA